MPLYHDFSQCPRRERLIHPWHASLLAEFVLAIKGERYTDRPERPATVHTLTSGDISNDVVVLWAFVRRDLARDVVDAYRDYCRALMSGDDDVVVLKVPPSLPGILLRVVDDLRQGGSISVPAPEFHRARRDLHGFVGARVAACRAKLELDQVFAAAS